MDRPIISVLSGTDLSFCKAYRNYTSLRWENKSAGPGDFEFHLPFEEKITCGNIVKLSCDITEPYGVILYVKLKRNETIVIGKMISQLLAYRYPIKDGTDISYFTSQGVSELICLAAKYGCTYEKDYFFGNPLVLSSEKEDESVSYDGSLSESCLEAMISIADDAKKQFTVIIEKNTVKITAGNYTDCGIIFDSSFGGLYDESYSASADNSRNVFTYSLKDGDSYFYQRYPVLSQPEGAERKVLYLGKFDSSPGYELRKKRSSLTESECFEANIMPSLRTKIHAGGKIKIKKPEWNIDKTLNITSVTDVWEEKYSCSVIFGNSQPTVYEKLIQRFR